MLAYRSDLARPLLLPLARWAAPSHPFPLRSCDPTCRLRGWRALPDLQFVADYHDHPGYIEALRASVAAFCWSTQARGRAPSISSSQR